MNPLKLRRVWIQILHDADHVSHDMARAHLKRARELRLESWQLKSLAVGADVLEPAGSSLTDS